MHGLTPLLRSQPIQLGVRLFRNASIYGVGIVLIGAGRIILLPIYLSRLTTEDYGILGLVTIVSSVVAPILSLGLPASMERLYLEWPADERRRYVGAVWVTGTLFGLTLTLLLDRTGDYLFPALVSQVPFNPYIRITLWTAYFQGSWLFPLMIFRVTENLRKFTLASVGAFLVEASLGIYLVVWRGMGATGVLLAGLINAGIWAVLWAAYMVVEEIALPFGRKHIEAPLRFGLPLVPTAIVESVGSIFDRFFLDKFVPLSAVGVYSLGKQLGGYLSQINRALKSSWIPLTYRLAAEQPESTPDLLPKLSVMYVAVVAWFASAMALLGSDLIDLSGTDRFVDAYPLIPFFALSYFVLASGSGLGRGLDIAKDMRLSPVIPLVSLVVSFVSNYLLVRPFGLYGAILAFFLTALATTGVHVYLAHKVYPRRFPVVQIALIVASGILVFLAGSSFTAGAIGPRVVVRSLHLLVYAFILLGIAVGPMAWKGLARGAVADQNAEHPILLIADHKWRDLPGMALLKTILEDVHQLPAIVTNYWHAGAGLLHLRPRALVMTTLIGPREQKLARAAHAIGAAVVVIPTEGIPGSREDMTTMLRSPEVWQECDLYLPWGPAMAEFAAAEGYLPPDKVRVTGSGRFDFYLPPLRQHLLSDEALRARYRLRPDCSIVTWATTFIIASYLDDEERLRFNERDFARRGLANAPGYGNLRQLAEQESAARGLAFEWMRRASAALPQTELLVKPHPYEPREPYEQLVADSHRDGLRNLHLITDEYIWDLLNSASVHIHSGSTTGLEAWLMDVPTLNLRPGGYARFKGAAGGALPALDWLDDNHDEGDTFIERLGFYLAGGRVETELLRERKRFLGRWFHELDGRAGERQAEAIADLVRGRPHQPTGRLPLVGRRTPLYLLQYRLNKLLNRDFDAPILGAYDGNTPQVGLRDRMTFQKDVNPWVTKLRDSRKHISGHRSLRSVGEAQ